MEHEQTRRSLALLRRQLKCPAVPAAMLLSLSWLLMHRTRLLWRLLLLVVVALALVLVLVLHLSPRLSLAQWQQQLHLPLLVLLSL